MHKSATKCNETVGKWCKNKHGASKIIDTLETYHLARLSSVRITTRLRYHLKTLVFSHIFIFQIILLLSDSYIKMDKSIVHGIH
jgi:hypothetical protein